ncbi:hypothetical protein EOL96_00535 [Candidatus Saccharibacteria bacterium]|nr:hypothetical protein [Candidatus Saccharibacteria bacterium]
MNKFTEIEASEEKAYREIVKERNIIISKFPLPFALLTSFGLVATLYGFEHLIDKIPWFAENPWLLLVTGITCLLVTGAFYKKLD